MSLRDALIRVAAERGMLESQKPDHLRTLPSPGSAAYERMSDEQKAAVEAERLRRTHQYNYESKYNAGAHGYGTNPMQVFNNPDMYTEEQRREAYMHGMSINEASGQDIWGGDNKFVNAGGITPEEYEEYKQRQDAYRNAYENPYAADDVSWSQGFEGGYDFTQTPGYRGPIDQSGLGFGHSQGGPTYTGGSQGGSGGGSGVGGGSGTGGAGGSQGGSDGSSGGSYESQVKSSTPFMDAYLRTRNAAKSEGPVTGMFKDEM